jgi:hypothetical protein
MDIELQRRVIVAICEEWENTDGGDVDSNAIYERLISEDEQIENDELLAILEELQERGLISGILYIGNMRITDVAPDLCESV